MWGLGVVMVAIGVFAAFVIVMGVISAPAPRRVSGGTDGWTGFAGGGDGCDGGGCDGGGGDGGGGGD